MEDFALIVIGLVLCLILTCCCNSCGEQDVSGEITAYNKITVNGITYDTENIVDISYSSRYKENDVITLYLKDGSVIKVQEGQYTLADRKNPIN